MMRMDSHPILARMRRRVPRRGIAPLIRSTRLMEIHLLPHSKHQMAPTIDENAPLGEVAEDQAEVEDRLIPMMPFNHRFKQRRRLQRHDRPAIEMDGFIVHRRRS